METLRWLMREWSGGNWDALGPLVAPDVVARWEEPPEEVVCYGRRDLAALSGRFMANWGAFRIETDEIVELDPDHFLVALQTYGRGARSGAETQSRTHLVFAFAGDRISEFNWYFGRDRALTAAGLGEHAHSDHSS